MPQGYFCACQPSFRMMRRLPHAIPHGHICCKIWFCRCQIARIFTLKSVGQFTARASCWQFFCSGVSKIADFRHVDMEGKWKERCPYEDSTLWRRCWTLRIRKFSKSVSTLPRFLHRRAAGNMDLLTGDDAGMIRRGDRWLLILVRSNLKKFFERGFQKARFWTLDDESRAEKFSGGGVNLPNFSHVGVRGVWLNVQREFRPGKKFPQVFPKSLIFAM